MEAKEKYIWLESDMYDAAPPNRIMHDRKKF